MATLGIDPDLTSHARALTWFREHAGMVVPWPEQVHDIYLANRAKGIHKPAGLEYALSVRQSLGGPYDDALKWLPDGSWEIRYAQEGSDPALFTNKGLFACMRDRMPVGVLEQVSPKPNPTYRVLGLGQVIDWTDGFFTISEDRTFVSLAAVASVDSTTGFSLKEARDSRLRALRAIAVRQGQPAFRKSLLLAYDKACAITGCRAVQALEAAHISRYLGPYTNHVTNGLLLRADIHTLFDLDLIQIDPESLRARFHSSIISEYESYHNKPLALPQTVADWPSREALIARFSSVPGATDSASMYSFV